ncbi:MAG: RidA family protein [Niastella sp.]|nr:RidA family protein [Niastella sp.]
MEKKIIKTSEAPAPIGPYNQAVMANNFLFISGQIALDPASGELKTDTIEEETRLVMKNLEAILLSAKLNFSHIVKSTIFLSDMQHFALVNEIYGSYFEKDYPARETVAVKTLPKNVNVEISMIACA